jgi:hypothetical protein
MEATPHRLFGRKTLGAGLVEVVAALGTGPAAGLYDRVDWVGRPAERSIILGSW